MAAALLLIFPACMVWATWTDVSGYRIPNLVTGLLALGFLPFALAFGLDWATIGWHFATAFAALVVVYGLFMVGAFGAGDGKLIAATLLWLGPSLALPYFLAFALAGGAMALMIVLFRSFPLAQPLGRADWARTLHDRSTPVPYGAALGPGGLIALSASPYMALFGVQVALT